MKSSTRRDEAAQAQREHQNNEQVEARAFEAPRIERRGTLPKVTSAFGGTFNP